MSTVMSAARHYGYAVRLLGTLGAMKFAAECGRATVLGKAKRQVERIRPIELGRDLHLRVPSSDWFVVADIMVRGAYLLPNADFERGLAAHQRALRAAGKTPIIVDCGANIGISAIWFATRFPEAVVVAVEPEPENYALLARNAAAFPNIVPIRAAVSDHHGRVTLINAGEAAWGWATREEAEGEVETVTIADLFARVPNGAPLIVKIDIEGGEVDLFRSNTEWTAATPLIVFEDHDWMLPGRGTFAAVMKRLVDEPRDYFRVGENTFAFSHTLLEPADEAVGS